MISFALLSAIATGVIAYIQATHAIYEEAEAKLYALMESREATLRQYFDVLEKDILFHAQSELIVEALEDFDAAWETLPADRTEYLQALYIAQNPFAAGQRDRYLKADDQSAYSAAHADHHAPFLSLSMARELYDVFLIDLDGNIVYTALKENDFATNLRDHPTSGLYRAFAAVIETPDKITPVFSDFQPYPPSDDQPAGFFAMLVSGADGKPIGVLAYQIAIEKINSIMQVTAGMGDTGETYLVGPDWKMRSDSRFFSGRSILQTEVDTQAVRWAFDGKEGSDEITDYRGVVVYSAYKPIDVLGVRWAIMAEVDKDEILAPSYVLSSYLIVSGIIIASTIAVLGYLLASDLSNPIRTMATAMARLAENDLSTNISVNERRDEVGLMARALVHFRSFAIERAKMQERLNHAANHDSLTGLPNRNHSIEHLQQLLEKRKASNGTVTVMFADLDGFKAVNDKHGHHVGDQILKEVSNRFRYVLRENDLVARIGGDEFLLVISDTMTSPDCRSLAGKLLKSVQKLFTASGTSEDLSISVSIGIAMYPKHATTITDLLRKADEAMYLAKRRGKNQYVMYGDLPPVESKLSDQG